MRHRRLRYHHALFRQRSRAEPYVRYWNARDASSPLARMLYAALRSPDDFLASYLDIREVESLIHRHRSGFEDATDRVWRLLNLQLWGDLFITGRREQWWNGIGQRAAVPSGSSLAQV